MKRGYFSQATGIIHELRAKSLDHKFSFVHDEIFQVQNDVFGGPAR